MIHDLRYAIRTLRRAPGFTTAAVLCIALGIGANTAIFSLIEAALLRPLPVSDPQQLAIVQSVNDRGDGMNFSYPQFVWLRDHASSVELIAHTNIALNLASADVIDTPVGELVSDNYFAVLGVRPALGRAFAAGDEAVAVISHRYWRSRFHRDPAILGRTVHLNGLAFLIVGVAPPSFFGVEIGRAPDVFVPVEMADRLQPGRARLPLRNNFWLDVMGRVAPGVSFAQAQAEAGVLYHQANSEQTRELPPDHPLVRYFQTLHLSLTDGSRGVGQLRGEFGQPLLILMGIVGMVLLIACANVAGLLLARATARQREVAVRLALGAGRGRLIRQFVVESLVLSLAGGAVGLIFASWSAEALVGFLNQQLLDVSPDPRVLAFTFAIAVGAGLLFGAAPAIQAGRQTVLTALKNQTMVLGFRRLDLRSALVAAQVGISLLLVVGAGLSIRTLLNLKRLDIGIHADQVLLVSLNPGLNRYTPERTRDFYDQLLERVSGLPGVSVASLADQALLAGANYEGVTIEGSAVPQDRMPAVALKTVSPRFFETMGIALRMGRDFGAQDRAGAPKVAIVNEKFAHQFFAGRSPLGKRIGLGGVADTEIVGVIADTRYRSLRAPVPSTVYTAIEQASQPLPARTLHVRAAIPADRMAAAVREQVRLLDRDLPASKVESFSSVVEARMLRERVVATLAGFFGALALVLVSVGLYGVMAYTVQCRTREIGIRVSLGARSGAVVWMVMRRALWVVLAGVAAGLPLSLWLTRLLKSLLFGVAPGDPLTIAGATAILLVVAALAAYLPARRISRVDPMIALRYE